MQLPLSQEQVDSIWKILTLEQQQWIDEFTSQRKRDKWFEALAKRKGIVLEQNMTDEEKRKIVDDWELVKILDGGEGNRPFKCECGKSLRYQYTVFHPSENKTYDLGSTCIEYYTGLSAAVVRDIKNGILLINTMRDEFLIKIWKKEITNLDKYIEQGVVVPESIQQQVKIGIPLFKEQLNFLEDSLEKIEWQQRQEVLRRQREEYRKSLEDRQSRINNNLHMKWTTHFPQQQEKQRQTIPQEDEFTYTYESFMNANLNILKQIREKEESLSPKLLEEWRWMQSEVRRLKKEGTMDFDKFLIRMNNMMIPLRITKN